VNTIGQGFAFLPYITIPQGTASSTVVAGTANQVRVVQFVIPLTITVGKITANVTTTSGGNLYAGVYDATGNKLLEASLPCGVANGVSASLPTPVTLPPGTYYYATSASDTTCAASGTSLSAGWVLMMTKNTARVATAANAVSGGVMPATLGTLTYYLASNVVVTMVER
jgi:hypothetical protein